MLTLLAWAAPGLAAAVDASEPAYGDHSDEELTALAADWDSLDRHQRRALLTEMKTRMARRGTSDEGVLHIRTERRYGRLIRQPDGRVLRIETQVVHVRPIDPQQMERLEQAGNRVEQTGSRRGFGVGFERRVLHRRATLSGSRGGLAAPRAPRHEEPLTDVIGPLHPSLRPEPPLPVYPVTATKR
ncbi:MAG: hypothetical protein GVY21_02830 [Gammaproteobacteria bacterium]|jgi:hypothetical protein|nr:hypothetical protein [Gammaproteobacteria bacterium]